MGREAYHHSNPRSPIPGSTSNSEPEPGPTNIWVQCLDGHTVPDDQLIILGETEHKVTGQHHESTQLGTPILSTSQPYNDALGTSFCASHWGTPVLSQPGPITNQTLNLSPSNIGEGVDT